MNDSDSTYTSDDFAKENLLNSIDEKIIVYLINNNNGPSYAAKIADEFEADRSWLKVRCEALKDQGILLSKKEFAKRYKDADHYYLGDIVDVLNYLYKHQSKNTLLDHVITKEYYRSQINHLISCFENRRISDGYPGFSCKEEELMKIGLKYSWKILYSVLGIYDCEKLSEQLVYEYKIFAKHLTEGRSISVSTINAAIAETKLLGEDEKSLLLKEIYAKAEEFLDSDFNRTINVLDKNKIPFLFEQFLFDNPFLVYFTEENEREQLISDLKKVNLLVNDMIDPSMSELLEKEGKKKYMDHPLFKSNRSSFLKLH